MSAAAPRRYDIRILVAVVDPTGDASDTPVDTYYTRIVLGHDNIGSDSERVGFAAPDGGVWGTRSDGATVKPFTASLDGFTFAGRIPEAYGAVPVAGAPGALLAFPGQNLVITDGAARFYEILVKLPSAAVARATAGGQMLEIATAAAPVPAAVLPVDAAVEAVECAGRGVCDGATGQCACFSGYAGAACHTLSALVV